MIKRTELLAAANAVIRSGSDDFVSLTRISGLNPASDFNHSNLRDVSFGSNDVREFSFRFADLRGADLSNAVYDTSSFEGAIVDSSTKFAQDFIPEGIRHIETDSLPAERVRTSTSFAEALNQTQQDISNAVDEFFDSNYSAPGSTKIVDAMRYAVAGGKMVRAFLVRECALLFGVSGQEVHTVGMAIEFIHAYSLVHDDLPCLDDDDLRRGLPTVHKQWDEATAVLVGDGLHAAAFEAVAGLSLPIDEAQQVEIFRVLTAAIGVRGLVGGQMADIEAEISSTPFSLDGIIELQAMKTGALIEASCRIGAILGRSNQADLERLTGYGRILGLAFQIADDILDATGESARLGVDVTGRSTFVSLLGKEGAELKALQLVDEAIELIEPFGELAETLREAIRFVLSR